MTVQIEQMKKNMILELGDNTLCQEIKERINHTQYIGVSDEQMSRIGGAGETIALIGSVCYFTEEFLEYSPYFQILSFCTEIRNAKEYFSYTPKESLAFKVCDGQSIQPLCHLDLTFEPIFCEAKLLLDISQEKCINLLKMAQIKAQRPLLETTYTRKTIQNVEDAAYEYFNLFEVFSQIVTRMKYCETTKVTAEEMKALSNYQCIEIFNPSSEFYIDNYLIRLQFLETHLPKITTEKIRTYVERLIVEGDLLLGEREIILEKENYMWVAIKPKHLRFALADGFAYETTQFEPFLYDKEKRYILSSKNKDYRAFKHRSDVKVILKLKE